MSLKVDHIRADFPILEQKIKGKPLIYLDNAATTQKPLPVLQKYFAFYNKFNANAHRGVHYLSNKATQAYEAAREKIRHFINAEKACEIIFTKGTTESINLVAGAFELDFIRENDEIIVTEMEHHSNYLPWKYVCERKRATLKILPFNDAGELLIDELSKLITPRTKMIAVTYISNVLGVENPIKKITALAHQKNIPVMIDAAQAMIHKNVDVQDLDCDFLAFSGHKMFAPYGIGVLYGKEEWLNRLAPWQSGGEMVDTLTRDNIILNDLPHKFEPGTSNIAGAVALAKSVEYHENMGFDAIQEYEKKLNLYTHKKLSALEGITIYGNNHASPIFSFNLKNIHAYDMGLMLDNEGIAVRTGHLCAGLITEHYNISGMVRISLAYYNTFEEIDILCEKLKALQKFFQKTKK